MFCSKLWKCINRFCNQDNVICSDVSIRSLTISVMLTGIFQIKLMLVRLRFFLMFHLSGFDVYIEGGIHFSFVLILNVTIVYF